MELVSDVLEHFSCNNCDVCQKRVGGNFYHFTPNVDGGDICAACWGNNWRSAFKTMDVDMCRHAYCDLCQRGLTDEDGNSGKAHMLSSEGMVCPNCWTQPDDVVQRSFLHITPEARIFATDREKIFPADPSAAYALPPGLELELEPAEAAKAFADNLVDSLVRPPEPGFRPLAWAMLDGGAMVDVPGKAMGAACGFAVRVEDGEPHSVASVVSDNHGRVAMNIVFNSYGAYRDALAAWQAERDPNTAPWQAKVEAAFAESHSCDDDLIEKASDSFAVVVRLRRNLSMYYG